MGYKIYKVENKINIKGFYSAFCKVYSKEYAFEGEAHNFWELMYVDEGRLSVSADDKIYELRKGDIIFHKPMEFHKFINSGDHSIRIMIMSFSALSEGMKEFENGVYTLNNEQSNAYMEIFEFIKSRCSFRKNDLNFSFFNDSDCKKKDLNIIKNMLELFLIRDMSNESIPKNPLSSSDALIFGNAIGYMRENIKTALSVNDIAQYCNVSASYLKKIFSKYAGIGVHSYFLNMKIQEATRLLKDNHSVTQVAEKLGFSSQSYFSTAYKRVTGILPGKVS